MVEAPLAEMKTQDASTRGANVSRHKALSHNANGAPVYSRDGAKLLQEAPAERMLASPARGVAGNFCHVPTYAHHPPPRLQDLPDRLEISKPGDALEQDADRTADRITQAHGPATQRAAATPGSGIDDGATCEAPPVVREALRSGGQALGPAARAFMEPRFGRSFAHVRVHSGPLAERAAQALDAEAYTVGSHIVFNAGRMAPSTAAGRHLLAHELAHVLQQASGRAPVRVQARTGANLAKASAIQPKATRFWVKVSEPLQPDALLREFVRQYYNETSEQEVDKKLILWGWNTTPRKATAADVAKGGLFLVVTDVARQRVAAMTPEQRQALNDQTDKRFWALTNYKPTEKLSSSAPDRAMGRKWLGVRTDILAENEASRQISELPADIKEILFAGDRTVAPDEYPAVLRLAARLTELTPEQRREYISKINASSDSFGDIDKSIDRYLLSVQVREAEEEKTDAAAAKLLNKEQLYTLYRAKIAAWNKSAAASQRGGYSPPLQNAAQEAERAFTQSLKEQGFKSERDFTDSLEVYRIRFRDEAVHLAIEILAQYDHKLHQERVKLQDPAHAASIAKGVAATKAAEHYKAAKDKAADADVAQLGVDPMDKGGSSTIRHAIAQLKGESRFLHNQAEGEVVEGSGKDPLVDPEKLGRGTDREKLAGLDAAGAQAYLLQILAERQADTGKARAEFTEDPERIFSIPDLVTATIQSQGIGKDTVYAWIVRDHIADEQRAHLFTSIVLGILALILAVLVPGGGWVAAAALVGSAVISTAQAYEAIKEYSEKETDYRLNFIQDEPSLLWVGVAIAGAALDLGMAASAVFKISAAGVKELEAPLKEFAAATDAETAASRLATLRDKIEKAETLAPEVRKAMQAQLNAEAAFQATRRSLGNANVMLPPVLVAKYFEWIYQAIRKNVSTITKLRKEAEFTEFASAAARLEGAGQEELATAFKQVKKVVAIGDRKKMDEATLLNYVDRLAEERAGGEGAFDAITEEMSAWRSPTDDQIKAEAKLFEKREQLASLQKIRDDAKAELRAGPKTADGRPDQNRIKELNNELKGLVAEKTDPSTGRRVPIKGRVIEDAEADVFKAEVAADRAKVDPKTIMRQAFDNSEERAAIIEGVTKDQVGALKTKPAALSVDHIVSIKRTSEMAGFAKLTVAERNHLATLERNLIVMDKSANSSKGERSWRAWEQATTFYDRSVVDTMSVEGDGIYTFMQDWIKDTVRKR